MTTGYRLAFLMTFALGVLALVLYLPVVRRRQVRLARLVGQDELGTGLEVPLTEDAWHDT